MNELSDIIAMAEESQMRIKAAKVAMDAVKEIMAENDIVWGIWPEGDTFGTAIVKGKGTLMLISQGTKPKHLSVSAIQCIEAEQAEALRLMLGDGRSEAEKAIGVKPL